MKSLSNLQRIADFVFRPVMAVAILSLPVTSLPLLSGWMGGTVVAPATIIFVFLLCLFWMPLRLLQIPLLPNEIKPLLAFAAVALASCALAFFLPIPPGKGNSVLRSELEGLVTLAIGLAVYLVFLLWNRDEDHLCWSLRLINWTGLVILAWSFAQLAVILFAGGHYPDWMIRLQSFWSTRHLLDIGFRTRVTGFTYEPSWLANQLNLVFLPYWLAATVTGYSAVRKFLSISVENVLLAGGMLILFFSLSRIGLAAFLFTLIFIALRLNLKLLRWIQDRVQRHPAMAWSGKWVAIPVGLFMFLLYGGMIFGMVVLMAQVDPRMARFFTLQDLPRDFFDFAAKVDFLERVIYWAGGLSVFAQHPILGVGLGNSGFFFSHLMPAVAQRSSEILYIVNEPAYLANVKSIWVRLLAETGLVGFSLFIVWQAVLWMAAKFLRANKSVLFRTIGWMGAFVILAFVAEGFSVDTFALPYLWVSAGILTATSFLARQVES